MILHMKENINKFKINLIFKKEKNELSGLMNESLNTIFIVY